MGFLHMPNTSQMMKTANRQEAALKKKAEQQGKGFWSRLLACFTCQCVC